MTPRIPGPELMPCQICGSPAEIGEEFTLGDWHHGECSSRQCVRGPQFQQSTHHEDEVAAAWNLLQGRIARGQLLEAQKNGLDSAPLDDEGLALCQTCGCGAMIEEGTRYEGDGWRAECGIGGCVKGPLRDLADEEASKEAARSSWNAMQSHIARALLLERAPSTASAKSL